MYSCVLKLVLQFTVPLESPKGLLMFNAIDHSYNFTLLITVLLFPLAVCFS